MNGFAFRLILTEAKYNSEMAYWMNVELKRSRVKRRVKYTALLNCAYMHCMHDACMHHACTAYLHHACSLHALHA